MRSHNSNPLRDQRILPGNRRAIRLRIRKTISQAFADSQKNDLQKEIQDIETERLQMIKDAVMKDIVFEVSWVKTLHYDIDRVTQVVHLDFSYPE